MQKFALAMLVGAAAASHHHHHHAPRSVNYFAEGQSEEETNAMPVKQTKEAYLGDTDLHNEAMNVQMHYNNDAGLWQYELIQLQDDAAVASAEAKTAEMTEAGGYDMKLEEYGPTEKVQSLNPIAYQYWSDTN